MKFLFDQNISHRILQIISGIFENSTSVKQLGMLNASDSEIWEFAKSNDYHIITQDSDFNDLNSLYGFPPKIIWIRTGNLKTAQIAQILSDYSDEINRFIEDDNYGCFEIHRLKRY